MDQITVVARAPLTRSFRGIGVRQVRLGCGLVLFAYLVSHFLNHALGNVSLEALAAGVRLHSRFWQFPPVAVAFYAAVLIHGGLGIFALYQRREFGWKAVEPLQLALGLSIPLLIAGHIIGGRLGQALFDQEKLYPQELYVFLVAQPYRAWLMSAVMIIAWMHGCIGLHFWLRLKPFYPRAAPWLLGLAVLVPTLALLGLYQAGRSVVAASQSPQWQMANLSPRQIGTPAEQAVLERLTDGFLAGYLGLLGVVLLARAARVMAERRGGMIALSYSNGRTVKIPKGLSVLEASLRHGVPHASVCGGRARCSTCRIRVIGDCSALPAPSAREAFVLARVGATDPSIRLACQLRPNADLSFFQIVTPGKPSPVAHAKARVGQERYLVSLFVDMRGSTRLAEKLLPFDTVFIVNRFLAAVSQAVIEAGGSPNQFLGDGMLALFGLAANAETASRQALRAAAAISAHVDELNQVLGHDQREPIGFGIGIHGGEVIVGDIGYRDHMVFTALGDAVNVASRLQDMTKALGCEAILSDEVLRTAGLGETDLPGQHVAIRGRDQPMAVRVVADAKVLAGLAGARDAAAA
jgi:adenylate cyclase